MARVATFMSLTKRITRGIREQAVTYDTMCEPEKET